MEASGSQWISLLRRTATDAVSSIHVCLMDSDVCGGGGGQSGNELTKLERAAKKAAGMGFPGMVIFGAEGTVSYGLCCVYTINGEI